MFSFPRVIISDEKILENKKEIFKKSYNKTEDKIIVVTDFDFTLFNKYNYSTGKKYESSYGIYNKEAFGGDQKDFQEKRKMLHREYLKYEEDTSIDENIRKEKIKEWNTRALGYMLQGNFTKDSFRKMVEIKKNEMYFKKNVSKFYEKLIELNIPIIIVSGGIKDIILEVLKLLNIKGLEEYITKKRILFVANEFIFDENDKCIDFNKNIIYGFNKGEYVKKLVDENFPKVENAFVLGDLDIDYKSIEELNMDKDKNVIGIGYLYYYPNEIKKKDFNFNDNTMINTFKKIYDINLLLDEGYDYPLELLNIFK